MKPQSLEDRIFDGQQSERDELDQENELQVMQNIADLEAMDAAELAVEEAREYSIEQERKARRNQLADLNYMLAS